MKITILGRNGEVEVEQKKLLKQKIIIKKKCIEKRDSDLTQKKEKSIATVVLMSFQRARNNAVCFCYYFLVLRKVIKKRKQTTFGFKVKKSK